MKSAPSLLKVKPKIIKDLHYVENKYYNNYIFLKAKLQLFKKLALIPVSDLTIWHFFRKGRNIHTNYRA